jgi:uncharacterized membrane protein
VIDSLAITEGVDLVARGLEVMGVVVIGVAFLYGSIRGLLFIKHRKTDSYPQLKIFIGKALQLGLEFLVAADIIGTVTVKPTRESIVSLGLLVVVRTFLSWSITVETEGRWPWQPARDGVV